MKKFRFSLSSVMVVREAREALRKEVFVGALRGATDAETAVQKVIEEGAALAVALAASRAGTYSASLQVSGVVAEQRIARTEVEARSVLSKARQLLEQRRTEWLAARRDLRLLQRLKDRAKERYRTDLAREEQRELDDRPRTPLDDHHSPFSVV